MMQLTDTSEITELAEGKSQLSSDLHLSARSLFGKGKVSLMPLESLFLNIYSSP